MLSLSLSLLMVLEERPLTFGFIREILEKVSGYENRKVIWSTLERLAKNGFIKKKKGKTEIEFSLTKKGETKVLKKPSFIGKPQKAWDRKWTLIAFEIPEKRKKDRDKLTLKLKEMSFGKLQNSLYISPHDNQEKVKKIAKEQKLDNEVKIMRIEKLHVSDLKEFAQKIWDLENLNQRYKEFVLQNREGFKGEELSSDVLRFWLKKAHFEYLNILHEDPVLPKELLQTDWQGYEAAAVFEKIENILSTY